MLTIKDFENDPFQHIVIRQMNYVAGTSEKPEVKIFMQSRTKGAPLALKKFKVNQTVWMKWSGGPIVARAKISHWHEGVIRNGRIDEARALTQDTNLHDLNAYWNELKRKGSSNYVIVRLKDEEWLENLIYPSTRSLGSSWIYLDTKSKFESWILSQAQEITTKTPSRSLPLRLRYEVLRRDSYTCQYCGRKAPLVQLHVDHVIPWSIVKEHKIENLVTACAECNLGKSDKFY
jgi:hypothetical protein